MLYGSKLWSEDIEKGLGAVPEIRALENKSVLITGAAGLICSTITDLLFAYNENSENKITLLLAGRSREKMNARFGAFMEKDYVKFIPYDASVQDNHIEEHADYIIHGANNAFPGMVMKQPVETMAGNFTGLMYLLAYAGKQKAARVLYISSSEVYGQKKSPGPFREDEYGYIDLLNPRNSYSVGKRAAETLCAAYAAEYGTESVIVRPGHIYGPTASPEDNRVSSMFAYAAARGEDLVLKSDGSQLRSYCYCVDCAAAILKVLLCGGNMNAYNISNPDSVISIKEMAGLLAEAGGVRLTANEASADEKKAFNPMPDSSLNSDKLMALGWRGIFDAREGLTHTVRILREQINNMSGIRNP